MNAAEALAKMDELGAVNIVPTMRTAFERGICTIPETGWTLVCNDANREDPRFSIVRRSRSEQNMP